MKIVKLNLNLIELTWLLFQQILGASKISDRTEY